MALGLDLLLRIRSGNTRSVNTDYGKGLLLYLRRLAVIFGLSLSKDKTATCKHSVPFSFDLSIDAFRFVESRWERGNSPFDSAGKWGGR